MKRYFVIAAAVSALMFTQCGNKDGSGSNSTHESAESEMTDEGGGGERLDGDTTKARLDAAGNRIENEVDAAGNKIDHAANAVGDRVDAAGNKIDEAGNSVTGKAKDGSVETTEINGTPVDDDGHRVGHDNDRLNQEKRTDGQKASDRLNRAADRTSKRIDSALTGKK